MSWLSFLGSGSESVESLRDIFPIPILQQDFVTIDVQNIYSRILTDVLERTHGIPEEAKNLLWDNCLASDKQDGLLTMVAKAMVNKKELYLVYRKDLKLIRAATPTEETQIQNDYKERGESKVGVYVTFKNYIKSDIVKFYSTLEYCAVGGLWKQANLSKAILIKISDLRASVSLADASKAMSQAKNMADGLADGKDISMDAKDIVESLSPDLTATNSTLDLISKKHSFYLGLPASYFSGEGESSTLSDTGKADSKAVERGLKPYYFSIAKPLIEGIFGVKTTFKSDDAEGLVAALNALEIMDRTSNEFLSLDNKTLVVNRAFGLEESQKGEQADTGGGGAGGGTDIQATALNGAQVAALVQVATAIQLGQIGQDAARSIISLAFPNVSDQQLASIVKKVAGVKPPPPNAFP